MLERRGHWLLGVMALSVYAPTLANGLTNWDDGEYTTESPFVTAGMTGLIEAFRQPYDGAYTPLSHAVLVLAGARAPSNPLPYHLAQWALFALAALLMPRALSAFGLSRRVCLAATLLWLVHPFRVESAAWVGNMKDTVSLLGAAGAFALYAAGRPRTSALVFALGLLGKASLAPLALFFLALEWSRAPAPSALLASLKWLAPALLAGGAALLIHRSLAPASGSTSWITPLFTPFWYLGRTLLPVGSRAVYGWQEPSGVGLAALLAAWCVVGVLLVIGLRHRTRQGARRLALGALAFLVPLLPFVGVVPQSQPVAERYTLYPSLVLAVGVAALLLSFGRVGLALIAALSVALTGPLLLRQREWKDGVTLWESNLALEPSSVVAHLNFAGALGGQGRFGEAVRKLLVVRSLQPALPGLDCYIAMARAGQEKLDPSFAVTELKGLCALPANERWAAAARIIARKDATARLTVEELAFGKDRAKAAAAAAAFSLERDEQERAIALAAQARQWDPSLERALITQAVALLKLKRLDEARALTTLDVSDPRVAARLLGVRAAVLNEQGQFGEAERLLQESTQRLRDLGERP